MKVKLEIDTNTFVRFGLVAIGFLLAIIVLYKTRVALTTIGVAMFFALALNPPVSRIAKRMPGNSRVGATALAYLIVIGLLAGFVFTVVPPVIEQSSKFAETVPNLIDQTTQKRAVFDDFVHRYGLENEVNTAIDNAKSQASSIASNLGNSLVGGVGALFSGAATVIIVLVLSFLMLVEGPEWLSRIWGLYEDPERLKSHRTLVNRMYRVVTGFVNGQMIVALIASTASLTTLLILSAIFPLPANLALPLAALIFVTGLIPMIGATLGAIVVTLVLMLNDFGAALTFLIYFIIYQQIENNFIAPTIQSKTVELSALAVMSAILIGVTLFGLLGGLISIPIAGSVRVLVLHMLERNKRIREKKEGPISKLVSKVKEA
jgi:predicted PurR-regulated permease PerM